MDLLTYYFELPPKGVLFLGGLVKASVPADVTPEELRAERRNMLLTGEVACDIEHGVASVYMSESGMVSIDIQVCRDLTDPEAIARAVLEQCATVYT